MAKVSSDQLKRIRETLVDCAPFSNERQLRALFIDPRVKVWRRRLPTQSENLYDLINTAIELLLNAYSSQGENALVLFLEIVAGEIDKDDLCHQQVSTLASELRAVLEKKLAPLPGLPVPPTNLRVVLLTVLDTRFNKSELRQLCFHLDLEYEDLPGSGKADKVRELVLYMERRDHLIDLFTAIQRLRPDIIWPYAEHLISEPEPVEAQAGTLQVTLQWQGGKWRLKAQNQGDLPLRQVNIVLRPSPAVTAVPNRVLLGALEAGETVQAASPFVIRANQGAVGDTCPLDFEAVYRTPEKIVRHNATLLIPVT